MSGEVNMIQTLRKFRGGPDQANLGGASLETFLGEAQLKKSPCNICRCLDELNLVEWTIVIMKVVSGRQLWVIRA